MSDQSFADISTFVSLARLVAIALSPDGTRLVAAVQEPDAKGARYASSLWDITPGREPARLTRSAKGESSPAFLPDGSLLFVSSRPDVEADDDESMLWLLPASGEPRVVARSPGGLSAPLVARDSGTVVVHGSRLLDSVDADDDRQRRQDRKDRKITAILHTGMPIRFWDHELGFESPRLLGLEALDADAELRDLTSDAGFALTEAQSSICADGSLIATTWRRRLSRGRFPRALHVIDVRSGERRVVAEEDEAHFEQPAISPDAARVALLRSTDGDFETPLDARLQIYSIETGDVVDVGLGNLMPTELAWSPDSTVLFVAGDENGRGPVVVVDPNSGEVLRRLTADGAYSNLCPTPDGRHLYAIRSAVDAPPAVVRLDVATADQRCELLPAPLPLLQLPGQMKEVSVVAADGVTLRGWLCLPDPAELPAPLLLFVHGGPFMSSNSWSWRWNPWVAVARGYAVLVPDPALSTGYGPDFIARAWPHRAELVWRDLETLLDSVVQRPDIDADRVACLGGSFGGFMTNWIAGHTSRFGAIVTHAGLWALDQQHTTTDGSAWKSNLFGTPAEHPQWYAENSPHHFVDQIVTPMLVVHGNKDYRVPISEALRLWWDLASRYEPDELPHRFLQLTGENHWVLSPANAQIWYETVLDFCDQHLAE